MPIIGVPYVELSLVVVRGLKLTSAAPMVATTLSAEPPAENLALSSEAPALFINTVSPAPASLALTGSSVSAFLGNEGENPITQGELTLAGYAPSRAYGLLLRGYEPNVALSTPSLAAGSLALASFAPTITNTTPQPTSVQTFVREAELGTYNPALEMGSEAELSSLGLEGWAPTASITSPTFFPARAELRFTGYAPVDYDTIAFQPGALLLASYAPSLRTDYVVAPAATALSLVGTSSTLFADTKLFQPDATALVLTAEYTYVGRSITPEAIARRLNGKAPAAVVGINRVLQPTEATFILAGQAPLAIDLGYSIVPTTGAATFAGYVPTLGRTANLTALPGAGVVTLQGAVPLPVRVSKSVGAAALTMTGYSVTLRTKRTRKRRLRFIRLTACRHVRLLFS